jgi:hypothetical protein
VACLLAPVSALAGEGADAVFEQMKGLAGTWDAETPNGPATINYRVGSAGSVVIEELFPGTDHEMMTVYHLDGDELVATHYCAAGNQPRFKLDPASIALGGFHFAFAGGSNMQPGDGHVHEGTIRIVDADHVEATWTSWKDGKPDHEMTFSMTRGRDE